MESIFLTTSTRFIFCCILLFVLAGCSKPATTEHADPAVTARTKLDAVLPEMLRLANDEEKRTLSAAKPFVNVKGLDMKLAGFSIPVGTNGQQVHISFTADRLRNGTPKELASAALEDFRMATK